MVGGTRVRCGNSIYLRFRIGCRPAAQRLRLRRRYRLARTRKDAEARNKNPYTYIHIYIYILIYTCVSVWTNRQTKNGRDKPLWNSTATGRTGTVACGLPRGYRPARVVYYTNTRSTIAFRRLRRRGKLLGNRCVAYIYIYNIFVCTNA